MSATISAQLARFAADTDLEAMPAAVIGSVERRYLDTLGICLAASAEGLADGVGQVVEASGGAAEATLVGRHGRFPAAQAALYNGTLAHSLDFDDTHLPSILHPSASVIPAALATAEAEGADSGRLLAATAVGIEIAVRTGMGGYFARQGNVFFERGWHATSICGTIGAAAASAKLLGCDASRIADAIGIATSMGAGIIEANRMGGTVKRLHCGWAAHAGVIAAQLARCGYTAPDTAFEGRFGFYRAFVGERYNRRALLTGLGKRWEIPNIHFKPYPANHYTHAAIDAILAIRSRRAIDPEEVAGIELGTSRPALRTIGEPRQEKIRPRSGYHAAFSGPFVVAATLLGGGGLGLYFGDLTDEKARDPRYLALAAKVSTFVDDACDRAFPNAFATVLRLRLRDGWRAEERVMHNRGGPVRPLSEAELLRKFELNATRLLSSAAASALSGTILSLADGVDVRRLARGLAVDVRATSTEAAPVRPSHAQ